MSFTPDPGSTLPTTSLASTALTDYIRKLENCQSSLIVSRDSTFGKQLVSMYNAAKSKRAFTSFRFRNRSEAQSSGFPRNSERFEKIYSSVRKPAGDRQVWAETVDARSSPTSSHGKLLQNLVASSWQKWQRFIKNGNSSPKGYFFHCITYDLSLILVVIWKYIYYMMLICKCWSHTSISLVHHHCLRRFCDAHRPSCSRWICSALRRYRSWQR